MNKKIILGIVIAVVIILGFYLYVEVRSTPTFDENMPGPDTSLQTDTSNWKTYTNEKYRFEFKYPKNSGEFVNYQEGSEEYWQSSNKQFFVQVKPLPNNFKFVERKDDVGQYINCKTSFGLQYCIEGFGDESYRSDQVEIYNFDKKLSVLVSNQIKTEADVFLLEKIISTFKFTK